MPTTARQHAQRKRLTETASLDKSQVDREAGVVRRVKLLGLESRNGRSYPAAVIAKAKNLYEGAAVYIDHGKPRETRPYGASFGVTENVTAEPDGLYGDLHYNPAHALAEQFAWDAENRPNRVGLSHDIEASTREHEGKMLVEAIHAVNSVDIVTRPATTRGLFEHEANMSTIREIVSANAKHWCGELIGRFVEDDMVDPTLAVDADGDSGGSAEDQMVAAFKAAMMAVLDDDSMDSAAKLAKLKELLKAKDNLLNSETPETPSEPTPPTVESLQRKLDKLTAENATRALCESLGVKLTPKQLKTATRLTEEDRAEFVGAFKGKEQALGQAAPQQKGFAPRSGGLQESAGEDAAPKTADETIKLLRTG